MGFLERIFGSEHKELNQRFVDIRNQTHERARKQSFEQKIEITSEAKKIGLSCDIKNKREFHEYKDIAIVLLANYPPELNFHIIGQFEQFAPSLGYIPVGKIYLAIEHIDEIGGAFIARLSTLKENPQLFEFMDSSPERTQKAAETLAAAMYSLVDIKDAREVFRTLTVPEMRDFVKDNLLSVDAQVGQYITS